MSAHVISHTGFNYIQCYKTQYDRGIFLWDGVLIPYSQIDLDQYVNDNQVINNSICFFVSMRR